MGVNKCLVELVLSIVLDLHNVCEREGAVLLHDKLERSRVLVECAQERALRLCNRFVKSDGRRRGGYRLCSQPL